MKTEVRYETIGSVGVLTLSNVERKNAFNDAMWRSLEKALDEVELHVPRVMVVTGEGEAFSAGFDVNPDNPQVAGLIEAVTKHVRPPVEELIYRIRHAVDRLVRLPVPVIAAVNGLAYGGGAELAVRCDMRVMDPAAVICFSEVKLGLMPDWGGGAALARLAGKARAAEMILTGGKYSAAEAAAMGLANRISGPGMSLAEATVLAETIAKNGPRAVRAALSVIRNSADCTMDEALNRESEAAIDLITSGECFHGISAFLAKKEPQFPEPE